MFSAFKWKYSFDSQTLCMENPYVKLKTTLQFGIIMPGVRDIANNLASGAIDHLYFINWA